MTPAKSQISDFPDHLPGKPLRELTADDLSTYAIRAEADITPYLNAWEPEAAIPFKTDPQTKCTGFWEDAEPQWRQVLPWRNP